MNNPFLRNFGSQLLFVGVWAIAFIARMLFIPYSDLAIHIVDAMLTTILQAICMLVLWYPVKYYRNAVENPFLLITFHLCLLALSLVIWTGSGILITRLFFDNLHFQGYSEFFVAALPYRLFFGFLVYLIFTLFYYLSLAGETIRNQQEKIENLSVAEQAEIKKITRISVKKNREIYSIPINEIQYFEANGDYVMIYTEKGKYLKDKTMKYWELHLPNELFVRVHRSYIVNIEHIAKIELYEKETYSIRMKNGSSVRAGLNGYKLLKQKMQL